MDSPLQLNNNTISQLSKRNSIAGLVEFFDSIVSFLNNNTCEPAIALRKLTSVCDELFAVRVLGPFDNPTIMQHNFFILLSRTFTMLFTKMTLVPLTPTDEQCLESISIFITNLCSLKNKAVHCFYADYTEERDGKISQPVDPMSYDKIFFTSKFMAKYIRMVENDISNKEYSAYHIKYKITDRLLRLWIKLRSPNYRAALDAVIKCLMSEHYLKVYKAIDLRNPTLTPKQSLLLYQCPKFIRLMSDTRQGEISHKLCEKLIKDTYEILHKHLNTILEGELELVKMIDYQRSRNESDRQVLKKYFLSNTKGAKTPAVAWNIELLNYFALTPTTGIRGCFQTHYDHNESMVDQVLAIISRDYLIYSVQFNSLPFHCDVALVSYSLVMLYNLTFDEAIHKHLKSKKPFNTLKRLHAAKDKIIRFTSRTLAAILQKEKIDEIDSPSKIAKSYLYMIENTLDNIDLMFHGIKLDGVLTNLETVVLNDEVKEEIVNEDGIDLLEDIVCHDAFDYDSLRAPAARIIESLSFELKAPSKILDSDRLLAEINEFSCDANAEKQSIAKYIQWNIEGQKLFQARRVSDEESREKYGIKETKRAFDITKAIYQYIRGDYVYTLDGQRERNKINIHISYNAKSKKDQEMFNNIYNYLKKIELYNISFNTMTEQRPDPEKLANDIEEASIVILCLSNEYGHSNACRIEAIYASRRNRKIIAILVHGESIKSKWLLNIIEGKPFIDFTTEFSLSCDRLMDTINHEYENIFRNE
ncbi:unnamed protein product [Adineta ricciae]|uniref:TIR domain-containing protein n=1 Tax=Adineta ricciae TaxID=249248 RepID=A0A813VDI1_ADIRI|nr:unnamed protein product [Adineta ricciae]CAF1260794.1 unnamed protein product [Adineta ricciae]